MAATETAHYQSAIAMVEIFASCKADRFDVTLTKANGDLIRYRPNFTLAEVIARIPKSLDLSKEHQQNIIIRPRASDNGVLFVQLDDLTKEKLEPLKKASFITIETSPNNYQAWIALAKDPKSNERETARALRQASEADDSASGATRLAGTSNFKDKYAPDYPIITITSSNNGLILSEQDLKEMGLLSNHQSSKTPSQTPNQAPRPIPKTSYEAKQPKCFPDYERCLHNAPANSEGTGQDTSRADFTWCMIAIDWGWSVEETAAQLLKVRFDDHKKHRNSERYAALTAKNASEAVERNKGSGRGR